MYTHTHTRTHRHKVHTREEGAQRGTDIINCQNYIVKFNIITPKEICLIHSNHVSEVQHTYDIIQIKKSFSTCYPCGYYEHHLYILCQI